MSKTLSRTLLRVSLVVLAVSGCASPAASPTAVILSPQPNAQFFAGDIVPISVRASGNGLQRVDLYINTFKYASVDQPVRPNEFVFSLDWPSPADQPGVAVIQIKGVDGEERVVVSSDVLFISLMPPPATPTPLPQPTPIPTAAPTTPDPARQPTATPILVSPLPANDFVNVRAQPSLTAAILGQIPKGQSVPVQGKSADGKWYRVNFPSAPDGLGWVFAEVVTLNGDAASLPVVEGGAGTAAPTQAAPAGSAPQPPYVRLKAGQEFVNVRSGPGTTFQRLGQLDASNPTASVRGKNAAGDWWQIAFPGAPNGVGWVFSQLVDFVGNAGAVPVVQGEAQAQAAASQATLVPVVQPTATPAVPSSALLEYRQSMVFSPRNDIGDVPLGHNGEPKSAKLLWEITGAVKAELEISTQPGPGIFSNCPMGNLASITPNDAAGKRIPLTLPSGEYSFTITERGYYLFTIYVTKTSGETTTIPRNVIVDCYKSQ